VTANDFSLINRAGQPRSQAFTAWRRPARCERRRCCACPVRPCWARELARVAPARIPEVILMKIDMCSDLAFLRGRSWVRTSDPSLV